MDLANGARETRQSSQGFEFGPTFSLPLPVASASRDVIGLDAGVRFTMSTSRFAGLGADLTYHYWPVSDEFKHDFSEFMRYTLQLGSGTWGLQVLQYGVHLRLKAPTRSGIEPWFQVGLDVYHVNPNTTAYRGDAVFFTAAAQPLPSTVDPGYSVVLGADLLRERHARMGLDATYHHVWCRDEYVHDLQILTVGAHMPFTW